MKKTRKSGSKMANGKGGPTSCVTKVNQEVVDVIPTPHCGSTIYLLLYRYSRHIIHLLTAITNFDIFFQSYIKNIPQMALSLL